MPNDPTGGSQDPAKAGLETGIVESERNASLINGYSMLPQILVELMRNKWYKWWMLIWSSFLQDWEKKAVKNILGHGQPLKLVVNKLTVLQSSGTATSLQQFGSDQPGLLSWSAVPAGWVTWRWNDSFSGVKRSFWIFVFGVLRHSLKQIHPITSYNYIGPI